MLKIWVCFVKIKTDRVDRVLAPLWIFLLVGYIGLDLTTKSVSASETPEIGNKNQPSVLSRLPEENKQPQSSQIGATSPRPISPILPIDPLQKENPLRSPICLLEPEPTLAEAIDWWKSLQIEDLTRSTATNPSLIGTALPQIISARSPINSTAKTSQICLLKPAPKLEEAIDWWKSLQVEDPIGSIVTDPNRSVAMLAPQSSTEIATTSAVEKFPPKLTPEERSIDKPTGAPSTPAVVPQVQPREAAPIVSPTVPKLTPGYLIAPRQLELRRVDPSVTQIAINDVPTTHRSKYEVTTGAESGDLKSTDAVLNATGLYSPDVVESVSSDRVYRLVYNNIYSQVRLVRQQRDIITNVVTPETALGMRQQISFVGDCLVPPNGGAPIASGSRGLCSYIASFQTDTTSIDPKQLIPRAFFQPSGFGDSVSVASMEAMKASGFQTGANGESFGIDLYFPKVGTQAGNTQSQTTTLDRFESVKTVGMASFGRVKQVIVTNGKDVAIGRTLRGFNYISGDPNSILMAGLQAVSELLPDAEPKVSPGKKGGSTALDRTLLLAANNNRIPESSFTAYYAGLGRGHTPNGKDVLAANYQGLWLGFSPVIERRINIENSFQIAGPERIVSFTGGEGGAESDTKVAAAIDGSSYSSSGISNAYTQAYLTRYERDITTFSKTSLQEKTSYYPHLSATGNVTTADSILRYYGGLIFNPNSSNSGSTGSKIYGGVDFTKVEPNGINYNLAAIGYINPDPEYYSRLSGNISKGFSLGRNPAYNLALSSGFNYAFDGNSLFDNFSFRSGNSFLNVGAKANLGDVALGLTYFVPNGMPNPINRLLSVSGSWQVKDGLNFSAFYTPVNENVTRSTLGASVNFRLGKSVNDPTLSLSWSRNETDFPNNPDGSKSGIADNVFAAYFRFGAPPNPFGR